MYTRLSGDRVTMLSSDVSVPAQQSETCDDVITSADQSPASNVGQYDVTHRHVANMAACVQKKSEKFAYTVTDRAWWNFDVWKFH